MKKLDIKKLLFLILSTISAADNNYIDWMHDAVSDKVIDYSQYIDDSLSGTLLSNDENSSVKKTNKLKHSNYSVDKFFRDKKFIDSTDKSYVSVRINSFSNTAGTRKLNVSVNARLPLSKSSKKYNIFINNLNEDDATNQLINQSNTNSKTEIGINYFTLLYRDIKSKYSIGTNGINPFTIARYTVDKKFYSWKIEPSQRFKYSLKNNFEEQTDLYFDKQLSKIRLFRVALNRGTRLDRAGMDYSLAFIQYWSFSKTMALSLSQSFYGNTEFTYTTNNHTTKKDSGITTYTTQLSFRQSILRKWFFYGLTPSVSYQRQYNYKVNYGINFYLEFYFGHFN